MDNSTAQVKLVSMTKGVDGMSSEELIAYTARVSNPTNQMNHETAPKLLNFLIKKKHWSPFEMASMTVEIKTSRAIAAQILRHRSFSFQEFSQRYAKAAQTVIYPARRQDAKNRQNSIDNMSEEDQRWFKQAQLKIGFESMELYQQAIDRGIAKEQARFLLPLSTETTIYMSGTIRSWIHYIDIRASAETQKEHRDIALGVQQIMKDHFPNTSEAMGWIQQEVYERP